MANETERHAGQRSLALRSEGPEWPTGRTCDAEFEFRRDEMRPMSTPCDGVGQHSFVVGVVVGLGYVLSGLGFVETKRP